MDADQVRQAYSTLAGQYIDFVDGSWLDARADVTFVEQHLRGRAGPMLDLGCGPGHWTAHLTALGADMTGVDMVPEFVAHARATYPDCTFELGSMSEMGLPHHSVAGILAWYSTIHVDPPELDRVLRSFRLLIADSGVVVIGFFDSDDEVAVFDHAVTTAYRWPVDVFARRLAAAGFTEIQRLQHRSPERPDRRYAAIAARAS